MHASALCTTYIYYRYGVCMVCTVYTIDMVYVWYVLYNTIDMVYVWYVLYNTIDMVYVLYVLYILLYI